jgi:hypothetical protein
MLAAMLGQHGGGGTAHLDGELRREQVAGHAADAVCAKELAYGAPSRLGCRPMLCPGLARDNAQQTCGDTRKG